MTVLDPAFENAGTKQGLEIWRIENFNVVAYPADKFGVFYNGDSYIVLQTVETDSGHFLWNLHFWLGKHTSQDESGTAAIKCVELDDHLGGVPVQYREVQEHESALFLSHFKNGVRYLDGGVKSGFHHVDGEEFIKKLLQVKGKRNIRVKQVRFGVDSMNKGDCFILQSGPLDIYAWLGPQSRRQERLKAVMSANDIRDQEHGGRAKIHIIDEYASATQQQQFFEELGGGSESDVKDADQAADDVDYETKRPDVVLYRISDADGSLDSEIVGEKTLQQSLLDEKDCFLLNAGEGGIFAWVGKQASKDEKVKAMELANNFVGNNGLPKWTPITRVIGEAEPPVFKQYFRSWTEPAEKKALGRIVSDREIEASHADQEFNVRTLHRDKYKLLAKNRGKALGFMPDDGTGKIEIWRIENFELAPVVPETYGFFFGGDSYVLRYTYEKPTGRLNYIVYFWQGSNSSQDERAASAIQALRMDDELGGKAVQIRVVQEHEPQHFLLIFKGKLVIFMGGHASGFRNVHDSDWYDVDGTRMFHVKGTCSTDVRAIHVTEEATSLNSDDVFVLETPNATYLWYGKGASDDEKEFCKNIVPHLSPGRTTVEIEEESEPDDFWKSLGGKGDYQKGFKEPESPLLAPRLFQCSDSSGKFRVEEIAQFTQQDLQSDDVMILDTGDEVYVWAGLGASQLEKTKGMNIAEDYLRGDPTERSLDNTTIIQVHQGEEPAAFTSVFKHWDSDMWQNSKSMEDMKKDAEQRNAEI